MTRRFPTRRRAIAVAALASALLAAAPLSGRQATSTASPGAGPASKLTLAGAIDDLGRLDYDTRVAASRHVRRTPAGEAVPALIRAVRAHGDGYVRYRALVLLAGFNDPRARDVMVAAIDDPNDRLRDVAYSWLEHHPEPALAPALLPRLDKEVSEFVRPSLVRALAALGSRPDVQAALLREVNRGQDFFRSTVIEALGDHEAAYAVPALSAIAARDGPLQDDAVMALARIGDRRALETIVPLQRSAPRERQPALAAAICLLGSNCDSHERFLVETLRFTVTNMGFQDLARSASSGLTALATSGRASAWDALVDVGVPAVDPVRAPVALAFASAAMADPPGALAALDRAADAKTALLLLRDGFDMLAEDFAEERFYSEIRALYWKAADASGTRTLVERVMTALDF